MPLIMNTTEIESALVNLEAQYPDLCGRIELPERTFEQRTCHALRIATDDNPDKLTVLIIGGVHAREWGGPDIVVNFAADLLRAYSQRKGLKYLKKTFSAADIRTIVEERGVIVCPCVNPDGVEFSHTRTHYWRKNRNPANSGGDRAKIGVDINRNYDFVWDFKKYFNKGAWKDVASDDPSNETFHGPAPFSEPETRNVKWLMDSFSPAAFLDLHSYGGDVLFSWGDDTDQSFDPAQNFTNPAFDGQRGLVGSYHEYISPADYALATGIALEVSDAMKAVRGQPYKPMQAVSLYPTSGTSDDYAFSRHLVDRRLAKTFGFTVEFNVGDNDREFLATADPKVLEQTMRDVIPGLLGFCLAAERARPCSTNGTARQAAVAAAQATLRSTVAQDLSRLSAAYEAVAGMSGRGGRVARRGLVEAMRAVTARATGRK
jgi:hypothetical protein